MTSDQELERRALRAEHDLRQLQVEHEEMRRKNAEEMVRFVAHLTATKEAHVREYAAWLQESDEAKRVGMAATAIVEMVMEVVEGILCHFGHLIDGHQKSHVMSAILEEIKSKVEFEFHQVTGIDHIIGVRDGDLRDKHGT
jgi:hypothetical protein